MFESKNARGGRRALGLVALIIMWGIALAAPVIANATTIVVNTNLDLSLNDGLCSLREAIAAANTNTPSGAAAGECAAGQAMPTVDTIAFNIPGGGVHAIAIPAALPAITETVTIDGTTQPGASANTLDALNLRQPDREQWTSWNRLLVVFKPGGSERSWRHRFRPQRWAELSDSDQRDRKWAANTGGIHAGLRAEHNVPNRALPLHSVRFQRIRRRLDVPRGDDGSHGCIRPGYRGRL